MRLGCTWLAPRHPRDWRELFLGVLVKLDRILKRLRLAWTSAKDFVTGVLDERFPAAIKQTQSNGGGDIIRGIVRTKNEAQSKLHQVETQRIVELAIRQHEQVEAAKLTQAIGEFRAEMTDRYQLQRGRR